MAGTGECGNEPSGSIKCVECLGKNGSTEHSKGNKTIPEKVATARTEDGHKQSSKTRITI